MKIIYFKSAKEFRFWLKKNYNKSKEQWVGYYKKNSKKKGITYEESLNEALCYGWIDGLTRSVDEEKYSIRFTPRKQNSNWSEPNLKRIKILIKRRLIAASGLAIYKARKKQ